MTDTRAIQQIGFLGAGNMARYIIGGLIADGTNADNLLISHPKQAQLSKFEDEFGVSGHLSNVTLAEQVDILVLCVKPQLLPEILAEISDIVRERRLFVISIAAGFRLVTLEQWLSPQTSLVRVMPNTAALVHSSASALLANAATTETQRNTAESLLRAIGITHWVENDAQMDAITAVSGSGPAYFYYMMEALAEAGEKLGLPANVSTLFTIQTALGAARLALETDTDLEQLRTSVTSKGGTTQAALEHLAEQGFKPLVQQAAKAACQRAFDIGEHFAAQTLAKGKS